MERDVGTPGELHHSVTIAVKSGIHHLPHYVVRHLEETFQCATSASDFLGLGLAAAALLGQSRGPPDTFANSVIVVIQVEDLIQIGWFRIVFNLGHERIVYGAGWRERGTTRGRKMPAESVMNNFLALGRNGHIYFATLLLLTLERQTTVYLRFRLIGLVG